jgi:hypothetical protein
MSQRPRLGGDGLLRLPESVAVDPEGTLRGRLSDRTVDPFEWTRERVLLAESLARLELGDPDAVAAWSMRHGIADVAAYVGDRAPLADDTFGDALADLAAEQRTVAWHLGILARLSEHRRSRDWDAAWGLLVLRIRDVGDLIVGGPDAGVWPGLRPAALMHDPRRLRPEESGAIDETARRVRRETADWPVIHIGDQAWTTYWEPIDSSIVVPFEETPEERAKVLGSTWDATVALERLLIASYVARAVERRFSLVLEPQQIDGEMRTVLLPREERAWHSILAPIYLQLLEALRRITEGEPGAAICRECGRPFLVLDARRRFFCNDRERFRHAQRERRRRLRDEGADGDAEP